MNLAEKCANCDRERIYHAGKQHKGRCLTLNTAYGSTPPKWKEKKQ